MKNVQLKKSPNLFRIILYKKNNLLRKKSLNFLSKIQNQKFYNLLYNKKIKTNGNNQNLSHKSN